MERSLRLVTYLVPSHPVELYECVAHFLEDELNVKATLFYESRDPIDLFDNRPDPFVLGEADLGTFYSPLGHRKRGPRVFSPSPFVLGHEDTCSDRIQSTKKKNTNYVRHKLSGPFCWLAINLTRFRSYALE